MDEIEIVMPNQHYFTVNMAKMGIDNQDEVSFDFNESVKLLTHGIIGYIILFFFPSQVLLPLDNPSGNIAGIVRRKQQAKL